MSVLSAVIALENVIGSELLAADLGVGARPMFAERYELKELRGRGANGVVCRAWDVKLHRDVALKLYPALDDPELERAVLREAQALARLEHPNVVRIHDSARGRLNDGPDAPSCLFVSMEFIEGRHLRAWIAETRRSKREILRVLVAAGEGLHAANCVGLVHRDVKPENIVIDRHGRVLVVDFGLARGLADEPDPGWVEREVSGAAPDLVSRRMTRAGVAPGTLEYMAPEARRGYADPRSDQFSFAMTAWESLTGKLPYDVHEVEWAPPSEDVQSTGKLWRRVRSALTRALAYDPSARHHDIGSLLVELRPVLTAPRRWSFAIISAAVLSAVAVGAWTLRARTQPAALADAQSVAASERCRALSGTWKLDTVVVWAGSSVHWYGVNGHYQLELETLTGCTMEARLLKLGDGPWRYDQRLVRGGTRGVTLEARADKHRFASAFEMASTEKGKIHYEFELWLAGEQLEGFFRQRTSTGAVVWYGMVSGGREAPERPLAPEIQAASCHVQCELRCPSASGQASCLARNCLSVFGGDSGPVRDCGAPTADSEPPQLTQSLVGQSPADLRAARDAARKGPENCLKAAEAVRGRWALIASSWTREIEVHARGCELTIDVVHGPQAGERLEGLTTAEGAWVAFDIDRQQPIWALIGWDPAFGVDQAGALVHANKLPEPENGR